MKVGDRVCVKAPITVYHHPEHRGKPHNIEGLEGEVIALVTEWQGRPVSANFPVLVRFSPKFKGHFREEELTVLGS